MFTKRILVAILTLTPATAFACYQIAGPPARISNSSIKVHLTFDNKPITNGLVTLWNSKNEVVSRARSNKDGLVSFEKIRPGKYKFVLVYPSDESIDIIVDTPIGAKSALSVNFHGDWCRSVLVTSDK